MRVCVRVAFGAADGVVPQNRDVSAWPQPSKRPDTRRRDSAIVLAAGAAARRRRRTRDCRNPRAPVRAATDPSDGSRAVDHVPETRPKVPFTTPTSEAT